MSRSSEAVAIPLRHEESESAIGLVGSILVGKDILELLSTAMYVDPRTLYREYAQNAADGIDDAMAAGLLGPGQPGRIDVAIDPGGREIRIRDNGVGVPAGNSTGVLTALGASNKRGTNARGFRGVGRLAGLGFCQYLTFRTRAAGESLVSEIRWDCRRLKAILRDAHYSGDLHEVMREVVTLRRLEDLDAPPHFFEVCLERVVRIKNDLLLNVGEVTSYLSQVGPVPMPVDFPFAEQIEDHLQPFIARPRFDVFVNGSPHPIVRPFEEEFVVSGKKTDRFQEVELFSFPGLNGETAAVGWLLHHGYVGALRSAPQIRGLRARLGDIQIGGSEIFAHAFPEERFNAWSVGEIHILDPRIVPNGRRDDFEQSAALFHIINQLVPVGRDIARRCRASSLLRNRTKQFAFREQQVRERLAVLEQGSLGRAAALAMLKQLGGLLAELEHTAGAGLILSAQHPRMQRRTKLLRARFERLKATPDGLGLLRHLPQHRRATYQEVFQLIYECSGNRQVAKTLIDRITTRLMAAHAPEHSRRSPRRGRRLRTKRSS